MTEEDASAVIRDELTHAVNAGKIDFRLDAAGMPELFRVDATNDGPVDE